MIATATKFVTATVDKQELRNAIQSGLPFLDPLCARYALGHVQIVIEENLVRLVATDGRALCHVCLNAKTSGTGEFLADKKTLQALRMGSRHVSKATIAVDEDSWSIDIDGKTVGAKLPEGRFPDWRKVFPDSEPAGTVTGACHDLRQLFPEPLRGIELSTDESGIVKAVPRSRERFIEAVKATGSFDVTLCYELAGRCLQCWHGKEPVTLEVRGPDSAAVFRSDPQRKVQTTCILMPLSRDR